MSFWKVWFEGELGFLLLWWCFGVLGFRVVLLDVRSWGGKYVLFCDFWNIICWIVSCISWFVMVGKYIVFLIKVGSCGVVGNCKFGEVGG